MGFVSRERRNSSSDNTHGMATIALVSRTVNCRNSKNISYSKKQNNVYNSKNCNNSYKNKYKDPLLHLLLATSKYSPVELMSDSEVCTWTVLALTKS